MSRYKLTLTRDWARLGSGGSALSITATPTWVGIGSWQASWPKTHRTAAKMLAHVDAGRDPYRLGCTLTTQGATEPAFAGIVTSLVYADGAAEGYARDSITVHGVSDMAVLGGEHALPDPTQDSPAGQLGSWSVYADGGWPSAEHAIRDLVRDNIGATAVARRRLGFLDVPPVVGPGLGGPVTYSKRFPSLLEAVREICLTHGLTARLVRVPGGLQLVVTEQTRNPRLKWSRATGTMLGTAVTYRGATATSALVGGQGEGIARVFTRKDATPPPGGWAFQRVQFVDDTGNDTLDKLSATADKPLTESGQQVAASPTLAEATPYLLGRDYQVGDLGPVITNRRLSTRLLARVEAVDLSLTGSGSWVEKPRVGEPVAPNATALIRQQLRAAANRGKA